MIKKRKPIQFSREPFLEHYYKLDDAVVFEFLKFAREFLHVYMELPKSRRESLSSFADMMCDLSQCLMIPFNHPNSRSRVRRH